MKLKQRGGGEIYTWYVQPLRQTIIIGAMSDNYQTKSLVLCDIKSQTCKTIGTQSMCQTTIKIRCAIGKHTFPSSNEVTGCLVYIILFKCTVCLNPQT